MTRLAFMGSPDFAVPALRALHDFGYDIAAVYCQPARPAGRGQAVRRCPVHQTADQLGLPVRTPARLRTATTEWADFLALDLDVAVVAAYGLILPPAMLAAPRRGCLNIHASLLPRWRGAAPIHAAVLAGDAETGVTIMQMDAGLDTGAMLSRESVAILPTTTTARLHDTLADMGARLILATLQDAPAPVPQPEDGVTYAAKLTRDDGRIDWTQDAVAIARRVRAFDPWPGTFTTLHGSTLRILTAIAEPSSLGRDPAGIPSAHRPKPTPCPDTVALSSDPPPSRPGAAASSSGALAPFSGTPLSAPADLIPPDTVAPGTVLDDELRVACGAGVLRLTRLQREGRAAMDTAAFLRGHKITAGARFGV